MRSAIIVVLFLIAAGIAAWFYVGSKSEVRTAAAGPAAATPTPAAEPQSAPALSEPTAQPDAERASVSAPSGPTAKSTTASAAKPPVAVTGRVVDSAKQPVAGARVLAAKSFEYTRWPVDARGGFAGIPGRDIESVVTDAQGRFTLAKTEPGNVRIAVRASGFALLDRYDVPIPAGSAHDLGDFELSRGVVLTGRVVDAFGRAVADAELSSIAAQSGPFVVQFGRPLGVPLAKTDGNGRFTVDMLAVGPFRLLTTSEFHPDQVTSGSTQSPGERVDGLEIVLPEGLDISGRVVDVPADLVGALGVTAWPEFTHASRTSDDEHEVAGAAHRESRKADVAADGSFVVRGARKGQRYQLSGARKDREFDWFGDALTTRVTVEAGASGIELAFQPESSLVFRVIDAKTKQPLETFDVAVGTDWPMPLQDEAGATKRTHPEGRVRAGRLRPRDGQNVTLNIDAVGYEPYRRDDIALAQGTELDFGVIELVPANVLTVRVLDATTGQPVDGARVTLAPEAVDTLGHRVGVRLGATDDAEIEFGDSTQARTDAEGIARLTTIDSPRCRLRVRHSDYAPTKSEPFELSSGASAERVVHLGRGGTVHAKLVGSDGKPKAGARIERRAPNAADAPSLGDFDPDEGRSVVTDAEGIAHFRHLEPGVHGFRAKVEAGGAVAFGGDLSFVVFGGGEEDGDPWTDVDVKEGGESDVTVVAPELSTLRGRITEAGSALAGATLTLEKRSSDDRPRMPFGPQGPRTQTGADGSYVLENVRAGEYTLSVTHADRVLPHEHEVRVDDLDERVDLDLPLAIVEGRVVDVDGKPVVNAEVWPERAQAEAQPRAVMMRTVMVGGAGGSVASFGGGEQVRTRTDADGRYRLRGVPADAELRVKSRAPKFQETRSEPLRVASGETKRGVDLSLPRAGALDITVVGNAPEGQSFYLVRAVWAGDGEAPDEKNEVTSEEGKLTLDGLKPGPWKLSVRGLGGFGPGNQPKPVEQNVEVQDGATSPVTVQMP
ncbi:MAG: carboxypeptidase regulatory-like domain-containing protein [Planctomycetes bacterium]|nr:carboxypeptidase regulatory-like domain-containing protein [Planctomycetota bacterium]